MQDERWRAMEWLFHNARGRHAEASTALARLVVSSDAAGDARKLLAASAEHPHKGALQMRAALLRKATILLRIRAGVAGEAAAAAAAPAAVAGRAAAGGVAGGSTTSYATGGAQEQGARAALMREYQESEVVLAAQRLKMQLQSAAEASGGAALGGAATGAAEGLVCCAALLCAALRCSMLLCDALRCSFCALRLHLMLPAC